MTWEVFERLFIDNYFLADHRHALVNEFERFEQGTDYYNHSIELAQYSQTEAVDMPSLISKFKTHLWPLIFEKMIPL